jgi:surface antigen
VKLFEEDFDPLLNNFSKKSQLKTPVKNLLEKIRKIDLTDISKRLSRAGAIFNISKEGKYLRFNSYKFDISSYLPHFGIVSLLTMVLLSSAFSTSQYASYEDLQSTILEPAEIETMAKSIDKYTPVLKENNLAFFGKKQVERSPLVTPRGFVSQPEAVLASFKKQASINLSGPKGKEQLMIKHVVKRGDSLAEIANSNNINISTLRWANGLTNSDYITPGDKLIVPKKDGVWISVDSKAKITDLVEKYSANLKKTLIFNGLNKKDELEKGDKLLLVGGEKQEPVQVASVTTQQQISESKYSSGGSSYNTFPYGWCTWYVASRKNIPWIGNARDWLPNSRAMGYQTGHTPAVGSIIVLNESWWGHVAIVEAIYGNQVKFSEMNGVAGWGRVNTRTIPSYSTKILGYIYK